MSKWRVSGRRFLELSVHAWYLLKNRHVELSRKAFKIALAAATVSALVQLLSGHSSADGVAENQPAKLAAMEGHFDALAPADLYLFGWVDKNKQSVTGLKAPGGLSFLVHQDFEEPITGLNAFAKEDRPTALNAIFQFYHLMVAIELYPVLVLSTIDPSYNLTVYNAAASQKSLGIMLTIAAIGAPLVLFYTAFVFWTFRGKVKLDEMSY